MSQVPLVWYDIYILAQAKGNFKTLKLKNSRKIQQPMELYVFWRVASFAFLGQTL